MATRDKLVGALRSGTDRVRATRGRILDEVVAVTGFHRQHATRVLPGWKGEQIPLLGRRVESTMMLSGSGRWWPGKPLTGS